MLFCTIKTHNYGFIPCDDRNKGVLIAQPITTTSYSIDSIFIGLLSCLALLAGWVAK